GGAVVPGHGGLERPAHPRGVRPRPHAARAAGRPRAPEQAVPQLPRPGRPRRPARPGARRRRHPADARPADPPGDPGRRQHARVRQEPEPRRGERAGGLPGDPAPCRGAARAPQGGSEAAGTVAATRAVSHPVAPLPGPESLALAWTLDPVVAVPLLATAGIYVAGWTRASRRMPGRFDRRHLAAFLAGLAAVAIALASPRGALARHLLPAYLGPRLLPALLVR